MIHSVLVEKLNKYMFIQFIFCFLPIIFIGIYVTAFISDVMKVVSVVVYNDNITKNGIEAGIIKEVDSYTENLDGTFNLVISGDTEHEFDVSLGDAIYRIYAVKSDWYQLVTADNECVSYIPVCSFIDDAKDKDDKIEYKKDGQSYNIKYGDLLVTVYLADDGSYKIEYEESDIKSETVDTLDTLEVELSTDKGYRFKFHNGYNMDIENISVNFCSNLPTNNVYYDESSKTYIKNISEDFPRIFVLGSNILMVMFSMLAYCVMLFIIRQRGELILLSRQLPFVCSVLALMLLPACILITFALL